MNSREEKLMKLYWKLWTSADFESDFQADWKNVYKDLQCGNHYKLPDFVIDMVFKYLQDWEKEG